MRFLPTLISSFLVLVLAACGGSGGTDLSGGGGTDGGTDGGEGGEFSEILVVTNLNDDGPGSLRQMIFDAPEHAAIIFDTALPTGTITLQSTLHVLRPVTIGGLSGTLGRFRIDGDKMHRIFNVPATVGKFELRDLILADGAATSGAGIRADCEQLVLRRVQFLTCNSSIGGGVGGAIRYSNGDLLAVDCAFTACLARTGGAVHVMEATARFERCSFFFNQATELEGGAIHSFGTDLTAINSSFIDNQAPDAASGDGGAVFARPVGGGTSVVRFYACTLVDNDAGLNGGGIHAHSGAGTQIDLEMHGTIAAMNTGGATPDVHLSGAASSADGTNNLLGIGNVGNLFNGFSGNQGGDFVTPLSPGLGADVFDALGRVSRTPGGGGAAKDAIAPGDLQSDVGEILFDQSLQPRNVNGMSDVGAIEAQ